MNTSSMECSLAPGAEMITSSAPEMHFSCMGPSQMHESISKETVETDDASISVGEYPLPRNAEHAQPDSDDDVEHAAVTSIKPNVIGNGVKSAAAILIAEQPSLQKWQQKSAEQDPGGKVTSRPASAGGWLSHTSNNDDVMELKDPDSMRAAAQELLEQQAIAAVTPEIEASDSAAASKRPRLSAEQRRMVMKQHAEVVRQVRALVQIMQRQIMLVGKGPLAEDADQQQQAEVVAIVAPPEENPAGLPSSKTKVEHPALPVPAVPAFKSKPGKLTPEKEAKLLIHFGLQDTLTREETQALAAQVGTSENEVRDYIGKLRGNMRAALQRLQRKATSGSPAGAPPRAHVHHATAGASPAPQQEQNSPVFSNQQQTAQVPLPGLPGSMTPPSPCSSAPHMQIPLPEGFRLASQPHPGSAARGAALAWGNEQAGIALAQQCGKAGKPLQAPAAAQGVALAQSSPQVQHAQACTLPPLLAAASAPSAMPALELDLSGLQAILASTGVPNAARAVQTQVVDESASAVAAASQQSQVSQSTDPHSSAQLSSVTASAPAAASLAAATQPAQKSDAAGSHGSSLGATSPDAAAAALAAVNEACAQDTATLKGLVTQQRSIRHECAGRLAGALIGLKTADGRHETLLAMLCTTPASVLMPVASSQRCLDTLADWIRWAMGDRQTTILRLLLGVLLRLPIPPTMLQIGRLLKAVSSMQSYKVPSVSFGATNLLHHWQQQDPSLASKRKCLAPAASVVQTGHTHPQKYLQHPSLQPALAKPNLHGPLPSPDGASINHSSIAAQQQPAALYKPFYRGVAGRIGSDQPAKSASARVLTADEIVQQNELRKRQAGGILAKGGSFKVPRLNNNSLLEAAAKRRQRPGAIDLKDSATLKANGSNSSRLGHQSKQQPPQKQQQQRHPLVKPAHVANGNSYAPGPQPGLDADTLQALLKHARQNSVAPQLTGQQSPAGILLAPATHLEPKVTRDWYQPPKAALQLAPDMVPGHGSHSHERHTQQHRQRQQPEAIYSLPKLIPASPGEPWTAADRGLHTDNSNPPHVPLLPTDPEEATSTYQWLTSLQLPQEAIFGRRRSGA